MEDLVAEVRAASDAHADADRGATDLKKA
jgi:hypothetical protein